MTDPAIEAARKAVNGGLGFPNGPVDAFAIASARKALEPIREWFNDPDRTLAGLAPLIFYNQRNREILMKRDNQMHEDQPEDYCDALPYGVRDIKLTKYLDAAGRHDFAYIKFDKNEVPVWTGISPAMCEARHNDWSWKGQHRYKGWPWEQTVERIGKRLSSERYNRIMRDAANRYIDGSGDIFLNGKKIGHIAEGNIVYQNFGDPNRPVGEAAGRYHKAYGMGLKPGKYVGSYGGIPIVEEPGLMQGCFVDLAEWAEAFGDMTAPIKSEKPSVSRNLEMTLTDVNINAFEALGFPIGGMWEAIAQKREAKRVKKSGRKK